MLELLITIALLGFIAWLVVTYVPMVEPFRIIFMIIVALFALIILLNAVGYVHLGTDGGALFHCS